MIDKTMTLDQQMQAVAERIAASCHPEDARLEIAYAIARNLRLDGWPCAHLSQTAERGEAVAWPAKVVAGSDGVPDGLYEVAKRNLRSLITNGSDDKELMLKCLDVLSDTPSPAIDVAAVREVIEWLENRNHIGTHRLAAASREVLTGISKKLARAIGDVK